jgi:serine/threonine protein kinase
MGEVYRATDINLKRQVAIKVLPAELASDVERLARFQREAEVLALLNHPNIAAIYGFERSGGVSALVMEYVEGLTLADRVAQKRIPIDEALRIARQIAEALEAAHDQGLSIATSNHPISSSGPTARSSCWTSGWRTLLIRPSRSTRVAVHHRA